MASRFDKRFIEQQGAGTDDEGAREGNSLLLTAGKLSDLAFSVVFHPHRGESLIDAPVDLPGRHAALLETKGHILRNGHVRPERIALEHHCRVSLVWRQSGDVLISEKDTSGIGRIEAGDVAKKGGLAATAGA